jgi:hypothetical protein
MPKASKKSTGLSLVVVLALVAFVATRLKKRS